MNRTYEKIFTLNLLHNYYTGGRTSDFTITPAAATKHLLKSNRWIFKSTAQGFFIGADNLAMDVLPQILTEKTIRLSFILKLNNTDFLNFTDLPQRSGGKDIYYLHSQQGSEDMLMQVVPLCPPVFTHWFPAAGDTTGFQIADPENNIVINEILNSTPGQQISASVNLIAGTPGLYRFMVEGQPDENIYITGESPGNGIFGLMEISLPANFDPQTSGAYQFQFNTRSSVWEYHILFGKDYNGYSFAIDDTIEGDIFTETAVPPNYDEGSLSVFTSQNPISYRESAKKGLQLVITAGDGTSNTFNHLPNPALSNPESKIYLTI